MSISIINAGGDSKPARVHSLPCCIEGAGTAKVDQYFTNYIKQEDAVMSTSLRGRGLLGRNVELGGYRCALLKETRRPLLMSAPRRAFCAASCRSLTLWNWDLQPSDNDALTKAVDWIQIAEALHEPDQEEIPPV